ncbi:jg6500 [Pararge aegeria aegeria]|uniref:Jg6500 protein n=1 Tax=Pararge aegeria aegeria TaxID=348720 RepID=A0A8S4SQY2_9NEOP|nr:jg6500 [Pararge aegeria aegeria]
MPSLTYVCQTWSLRKDDEETLAICQRKMERSMLGLRVKDRVSNKKTKLVDVTKRIRILKWNWAGHVCRLQPERWTKKVTEWVPRNETRKRGRPRKRSRDIFHQRCGPDIQSERLATENFGETWGRPTP